MPSRITGIYSANDGGTYYARYVGAPTGGKLFWVGEHPNGDWVNVMAGELNVDPRGGNFNLENGKWRGVPKGRGVGNSSPADPASELELFISDNQMRKSRDSGPGFGGSLWNRVPDTPGRLGVQLLGPAGPGLNGTWFGNDGGIYYITQNGDEIAWFGEHCSGEAVPNFANVFSGRVSGANVTGDWADVPYGRATRSGTLGLRLSGATLTVVSETGGFSGATWTRTSVTRDTVISALVVRMRTLGDDSRGGAVNYGSVVFRDGRTGPRTNLDNGAGLATGASRTASVPLPAGTRLRDLARFLVEHDGAPRNVLETWDNWDARIDVGFRVGAANCVGRLGAPLIFRFTGQDPSRPIDIAVP